MSKLAPKLLMLAICATAFVAVPIATPANTATSSSRHIKKHLKKQQWVQGGPRFAEPRPARHAWPNYPTYQPPPNYQPWPNGRSFGQQSRTCFRGIDCAQWPPPIDEDPDRKVSGEGI
jgi:Ni/Co efflux regulator RcnB